MNLKKAIICKGVEDFRVNTDIIKTHRPQAGDVAIFQVLEIGKHNAVQSVNGNNSYIYPGDYVMLAFGTRYATGQFEGYVPDGYLEEYQLLGKGGAIGQLASMNYKLKSKGSTNFSIVGYAVDENNEVINTRYLNYQPQRLTSKRKGKVILSLGSSMDSGKTTTAAYLSRGLSLGGDKVAYIKLTGTVYARDRSYVRDTGATMAIDFSTLGFPSTYLCSTNELIVLFKRLLVMVEEIDPDYIIVEIADGLLQRETSRLIQSKGFMKYVSGVFFSAGDSMSAMCGIDMLEKMDINIIALSGLFTGSPLLEREVKENTHYPVLNLVGLEDPRVGELVRKRLSGVNGKRSHKAKNSKVLSKV